MFYYQQSFPGQVTALVNELTSPKPSVETHLMLSIAYAQVFGNGNDVLCLNQVYYTQPEKDPPALAPFTHIEPQRKDMNTMKLQTLVQAATEQTSAGQSKIRYVLHIVTGALLYLVRNLKCHPLGVSI